jgi:hypothetical protein
MERRNKAVQATIAFFKKPVPVSKKSHGPYSESDSDNSTVSDAPLSQLNIKASFHRFIETLLYISPTHPKFCKLLLRDIANMMGKRSVESRWWLVCPNGHWCVRMDTIIMVWTNKCMEGARWTVGSCWVSW